MRKVPNIDLWPPHAEIQSINQCDVFMSILEILFKIVRIKKDPINLKVWWGDMKGVRGKNEEESDRIIFQLKCIKLILPGNSNGIVKKQNHHKRSRVDKKIKTKGLG